MKLGAFSVSLSVKDINVSKTFYENLGFEVFAGEIDKNYFNMAFGVVALLPGGFTAYFQYEKYFQIDNYDQNVYALGARKEF